MIVEVKGQSLKLSDSVISEGAISYVTFGVKFDKSWKKFNKTVRFQHEDSKDIYDVVDVTDRVYYIPQEVLRKGRVYVSAVGVKGGDTVITTQRDSFTVEASIDGGRTPRVSKDAYAEYVETVAKHSKSCKKAEKLTLEAKDEVMKARKESETFYLGAKKAAEESREILENVSGALDAIGIAMRDIRQREEGLASLDSIISENERQRALAEKERSFKERARDEKERNISESEKERELSERGRIAGERVRAMCEREREKSLRHVNSRLALLEEDKECYTEAFSFEDSLEMTKKVHSITLTPKSSMTENTVTVDINGDEEVLSLKKPLLKIGEVGDSIVFEKERTYTLRRLYNLTLHGGEEIYEEDDGIFVIPFPSEFTFDGAVGEASHFDYGKDIWISGSYLFLNVGGLFDSKSALSKKLTALKEEGAPLTVTFSLITPIVEELPFIPITKEGLSLKAKDFVIDVTVKNNVISTLSKLIKRIEYLEKQLNEKENQNELETKTVIP